MDNITGMKMVVTIGGYPFTIRFVKKDEIDGYDGRTYHNDRIIAIRDDLDSCTTSIVLRHELVHAILGTQGRSFQKKFDVEEMCEFIAYRLPEIIRIEDIVFVRIRQYQHDVHRKKNINFTEKLLGEVSTKEAEDNGQRA